jgi:hypothetical protein
VKQIETARSAIIKKRLSQPNGLTEILCRKSFIYKGSKMTNSRVRPNWSHPKVGATRGVSGALWDALRRCHWTSLAHEYAMAEVAGAYQGGNQDVGARLR